MKRIIALILMCAVALCFAGCREQVEFSPDDVIIDVPNDSSKAIKIEDAEIVNELWEKYLDAEYVMTNKSLTTEDCISVTFNDIENEAFESVSIFTDGIVWFYDDFDNYYTSDDARELYNMFFKHMSEAVDTAE